MTDIKALVQKHPGARICVMGGSPTLEADIKNLKADIWISANEHGAKIRDVDYIVAMDAVHGKTRRPMREVLKACSDAPIITPHDGDIFLGQWPLQPRNPQSGLVAAWIAQLMGAHPVILAGMNAFDGAGWAMRQVEAFREFLHCEIRAIGPLAEVWPSRKGRLPKYVAPDTDALLRSDDEVQIIVRHPTAIRGREWPAGTKMSVGKREVFRQLKHRMVEVK